MDSFYLVQVQTRDESEPDCISASDISDALATDFDPKHVVEVVVSELEHDFTLDVIDGCIVDVAMQNVE